MLSSILISVSLVSLISLVGVFFLGIKSKVLDQYLEVLISFASGSLLGGAFLHLLPETLESLGEAAFSLVLVSFLFFFALEKFFYWRHCHQGKCEVHAFTYLNLIGDAIHNFLDGTIIAAAFLTSLSLGITTSLAVIFHEIPQEIGDFSILIYGGIEKKKALLFNFFSALTAVIGAVLVYFFSSRIINLTPYFLPLAAGNFLYLAATDIIPELHQKSKSSSHNSIKQFLTLSAGVALMWILGIFVEA